MLISLHGWAQKNNPDYDQRRFHFGFTLAYNSSQFKPSLSNSYFQNDSLLSLKANSLPGFGLGIVSSMKLLENLDLRFVPSLHFASRSLTYQFKNQRDPVTKTVESALVDFPLLFKLKSDRLENFRLYALGGAKYTIDMASQSKVRDDQERVKISRTDYSVEYAIGADLYLRYFKLSPEIRVSQSLKNAIIPESHAYSNPIDKLYSRTIYLSLYFE